MNDYAIGVFDSGIGGLTVVSELNRLLPAEDIIYLGDTARLPYGTRSKETILKYAREDTAFLLSHKIKLIIAACGTVSSVIGTEPLSDDIPFTGVLLPAAQAACSATNNGRIGVIGTQATIRSGSYGKAIKTIRPGTYIVGNACPLFVPLVENGYTAADCEITRLAAKEYLKPMIEDEVDTLILGCTHYPLLREIIAEIMGDKVTLISPGEETAKQTEAMLLAANLLRDSQEAGTNTYFVTDSPEQFSANASAFLQSKFSGEVIKTDIM